MAEDPTHGDAGGRGGYTVAVDDSVWTEQEIDQLVAEHHAMAEALRVIAYHASDALPSSMP